jgi:hypothetical protein
MLSLLRALLEMLHAWVEVLKGNVARQSRWGRPAAGGADIPWSARKKAFGCLWLFVLWVAGLALIGIVAAAVLVPLDQHGMIGDNGKEVVAAASVGTFVLMTLAVTVLTFRLTDTGRLPGTRDPWDGPGE